MNDHDETQAASAIFQDRSSALTASADAAAVARATQEIQAALVIAQRFPRDEIDCKKKILEACKRKGLAEIAEYEYPRGGTRITGPTIDLLRAIASRWGRIRWGWGEVERQESASMVRCFAWDMQSLAYAERTFSVKHWRDTQSGGHALEDERDIYELLANMAARRVRACLEEVIDSDIVADAIDQCRKTLREGEKIPLKQRVVTMLLEFESKFNINRERIEFRLGNSLDSISENQFASLRRIYKSLADGAGAPEDFFKPVPVKPKFDGGEKSPGSNGPTKPVEQSAAAVMASAPVSNTTKAAESANQGATVAGSSPPSEPAEAAAGLAPEQQSATPSGFNPLKGARNLCAMAKVKEADLLAHLASISATDGSFSTLEELHMAKPTLLAMVCDGWPEVVEKIKAKRSSK